MLKNTNNIGDSRMAKEQENKCQKAFNKHYVIAFWITLSIAIGLMIGGALTPPMFIIDGSIFKAVGELFLWPALALGAKAIEEGRIAKFNFGQGSIHIGEDKDGNGLDDGYEAQHQEEEELDA